MLAVLVIACGLLMVVLFEEHCHAPHRILINPMFALLAGTAYYVLLPCCVIALAPNVVGDLTVYGSYLNPEHAAAVLAMAIGMLVSLWCGSRWARGHRRPPAKRQPPTSPPSRARERCLAKLLISAAFAALILSAYSIREFLFVGYDATALDNDALWTARGAMSSLYSLVYLAMLSIWSSGSRSSRRTARLLSLLAFVIGSVLLLSLGARLYVVMALLSCLSIYSMHRRGLRTATLALCIAGTAAAFGLIGVVRLGSLEGLSDIALNLALEPLLTSISLFTVITDNPIILFGKPYLFPIDFAAILPSFLFPAKAALFDRLADYGYAFEAPVGGYHLYFSLLLNFGIIGSIVLAFLGGYALERLSRRTSRFALLASAFLSGALAFTLFRDPFFISLVKNVFVMGILVPLFLTFGSRRTRIAQVRLSMGPSGAT